MFGRFVFWTIVFLITTSLLLHYSVEIPYIGKQIGNMPGDIILKRHDTIIYFPITSSAILSFSWTFLLTGIFGKKCLY